MEAMCAAAKAGADALGQGAQCTGGFDAQLIQHQAPAGFVLRQRCRAVAQPAQGAHHLRVRVLQPRFQRQLAGGIVAHLLELPGHLVVLGQHAQRLQRAAVKLLALEQQPLFKRMAVAQGEAAQKFAAIQRDG
jgi:hypothetical protein